MRFTQLAHVMPSIGRATVAGVGGRPSLILPRSIPVASTTPNRAERHTGPVPTVHVAAVEAPWGPIQLAAWDAGLLACESLTPFGPFVEGLQRRLRVTVSETGHPVLDAAAEQVAAFLDDRRRTFDLPIDLADRPTWDQAVLRAVCDVPWGGTATYGEIARMVDRPGAARAVGGAVARSPIGIVVPCHRIVAASGGLGGYGGEGSDGFGTREQGLRLKRELLLREGVDIPLPRP